MAKKGIRDFVPETATTYGAGTNYSKTIFTSPLGYRTGVFQIVLGPGDSATLQGRVVPNLPFVDILTVTDESGLYEVVLAPEMRVYVVSNSDTVIQAAITG